LHVNSDGTFVEKKSLVGLPFLLSNSFFLPYLVFDLHKHLDDPLCRRMVEIKPTRQLHWTHQHGQEIFSTSLEILGWEL
jgi:hypothetical protein